MDQTRIELRADLRANTEPLPHTGSVRIDKSVSGRCQPQQRTDTPLASDVSTHRTLVAAVYHVLPVNHPVRFMRLNSIDTNDIRTHVIE
jgi:hypothetical protein